MNFNLFERTIYLTLAGSRAYGCHTELSDWDYRGVVIAPMDNYIGLLPKFEQEVDGQTKHIWKCYPEGMLQPDSDMQVMELTKFVKLATACNPSIIEILFSSEEDIVYQLPIMKKLLDIRQAFITKQAKPRFCSYAIAQLDRIRRHKRWLDNPPKAAPNRADYGLPEYKLLSLDQLGAADALIKKEVDAFMIDQTNLSEDVKVELAYRMNRMIKAVWVGLNPEKQYPIGKDQQFDSVDQVLYQAVAKDQQFSENFLEVLKAEKKYRAVKQEWDSYQHWLKNRNPARAELEKKYHYDCKHASQLYRLLRVAREILETGQVLVKRPDAKEILAIKNGAWSYEQVVEFAEKEDQALSQLVKSSSLPNAPPIDLIQKTVFEMVMEFNQK